MNLKSPCEQGYLKINITSKEDIDYIKNNPTVFAERAFRRTVCQIFEYNVSNFDFEFIYDQKQSFNENNKNMVLLKNEVSTDSKRRTDELIMELTLQTYIQNRDSKGILRNEVQLQQAEKILNMFFNTPKSKTIKFTQPLFANTNDFYVRDFANQHKLNLIMRMVECEASRNHDDLDAENRVISTLRFKVSVKHEIIKKQGE